jgi:hypothetical protein
MTFASAPQALKAAASDGECPLLNATLRGTYMVTGTGTIVGTGPASAVGTITYNGKGNSSNTFTVSVNGAISRAVTVTGPYTVNRDCTGSLSQSDGTTYDFVVNPDGNTVFWIETDAGTVISGSKADVQPGRRNHIRSFLSTLYHSVGRHCDAGMVLDRCNQVGGTCVCDLQCCFSDGGCNVFSGPATAREILLESKKQISSGQPRYDSKHLALKLRHNSCPSRVSPTVSSRIDSAGQDGRHRGTPHYNPLGVSAARAFSMTEPIKRTVSSTLLF